MNQYGLVLKYCMMYEKSGCRNGDNCSNAVDDLFPGWSVSYNEACDGWLEVTTEYGYRGYVFFTNIKEVSIITYRKRQQDTTIRRISCQYVDVLKEPKVQACILTHLTRNSLVRLIDTCDGGWSYIRTAENIEGYVHTAYLKIFLMSERVEQDSMRCQITETAKQYLGTQYRWGGKSAQGIDCSGLAFISYFENGIYIYRDAKIAAGYPIHEITRARLGRGDLIFFPGHVAIYLGKEHYIHATANFRTPYVTINSMNPSDIDYREDLADNITGYGSIF